MKTVHDLSQDELQELRETYFYQLLDTDPEALGFITEAEDIPIEAIFEHYEGISFVSEDFFCNL